jgi:hypothetical protein
MIFNYINKDLINKKTSIHDSEITLFNYDYNNKTINLNLVSTCWGKKYNIRFTNVLYFESQNCNFWGEGYNIISGTVSGKNILVEKCNMLLSENINYNDNFSNSKDEYIEYNITFNSGDEVNILCKEINFEEAIL